MSWPKISIVTPSYNQGQFLEATLQSVFDQKYPNLEYIVMDGGSTDNSVSLLKKFAKIAKTKKINFTWQSKKDKGQTDAINAGLKIAIGTILAYLNSDDTYEPNTLKTVAQFFQDHPEENFLYGKARLIDADGKRIGVYNSSQATLQSLHGGCVISQPTTFWTRKLYSKIGPFDDSFHFTMDYEYWCRVIRKYPMNFIPEFFANARIHADAKTSAQTSKLYADAIRVQKKYFPSVHHDWIFTYVDGKVHGLKDGTWYQEIYYWSHLFFLSFVLQLQWNHHLPTAPMVRQYRLWATEALSRFTKRISV
ncbi:MAG TPA: glycosyltransferase family 2 protein [Patescibacteria group bacterium]|nr:glycosyltransferase family 2 protein [Patescibacteria group bacterium]